MTILKVAQLGHPVLRRQSEPVPEAEIGTPAFRAFLDDLVETMREYDGVGIAAPQVHVSKRVFAMEVNANPRYPHAAPHPLDIIINPVITPLNDTRVQSWEGCLSVPGLRGNVPRLTELQLTGLDRKGKPIDRTLTGFPAIIAQHECDHLDGHVYIDRMADLTGLAYQREFERYHFEPDKG